MSKKSSTVHLEESTWKEIAKYQKDNDISGRNDAIERMLHERRIILMTMQNKKVNPIQEEKDNKKIEDNSNFDILDNAILDAEDDMPE